MNHLRLLIIAIATICVLALGVFALVKSPGSANPVGGDDIIIKGGSLDIQCGANHKDKDAPDNACLGVADAAGKYTHKQKDKHITNIEIKDVAGKEYNKPFDKDHQPTIVITYK